MCVYVPSPTLVIFPAILLAPSMLAPLHLFPGLRIAVTHPGACLLRFQPFLCFGEGGFKVTEFVLRN